MERTPSPRLLKMPTVDVVCPPGVSAGDLISVAIGNHTFEVSLPPNVFDGDTFSVDIPDAPVMELPVLGGVVAALLIGGVSQVDQPGDPVFDDGGLVTEGR